MNTTKVTAAQIKDGAYIGGEVDVEVDGHLEFEDGLGTVRFEKGLKVTGRIRASAGTGIAEVS